MKKVKAPKKNILNKISQKGLQKLLDDGQPVHVLESAHQVRKSMHREGKKLYQEAKRKAGGKMETAVTKIIDDLLVRKSMSYAEAMNEFSEKEYEGLLRTFKLITIVTVIALLLILAHPSIMEAINNIK